MSEITSTVGFPADTSSTAQFSSIKAELSHKKTTSIGRRNRTILSRYCFRVGEGKTPVLRCGDIFAKRIEPHEKRVLGAEGAPISLVTASSDGWGRLLVLPCGDILGEAQLAEGGEAAQFILVTVTGSERVRPRYFVVATSWAKPN